MVDLISVDNHKNVSVSNKIIDVCRPLFKSTPVDDFCYVKEKFDGSRLMLSSRSDWIMNYFEKKYYSNNPSQFDDLYRYEFVIADLLPEAEMLKDARVNFDIQHCFSIHRLHDDFFEFFHFSVKNQSDTVNQWYVNNFDYLEKFILYFSSETADLISKLKSYTPLQYDRNTHKAYEDIIQETSQREGVSQNAFCVENWSIRFGKTQKVLKKREIQIAIGLMKGGTAKVIARDLFVSPRTVEYHIKQLKGKLSANTKNDLVRMLWDSSITEIMF